MRKLLLLFIVAIILGTVFFGISVETVDAASNSFGNLRSIGADSAYPIKFKFLDSGWWIDAIGLIILNGAWTIAVYMGAFLSDVIANFMNAAITTDTRFIPAWSSMRDLANMIIVIGFVIVGIATALRIKDYEAKKLLWKLILIAILINFSGLFCGLIIDASNIVTTGLGGGAGGSMPLNILRSMHTSSTAVINADLATKPTAFIGTCVLYALIFLATAFTFTYLSIILIARYAILIMLFILSPLAFVFWIFPGRFKKYQSEWWDNFLKWALIGCFASLVLWIATLLMPTSKDWETTDLSSLIIDFAIPLIFLYVGFHMTKKQTGLAAIAANGIIGAVRGTAGLAMATAAGGVGVAGKMIGGTKAGRWMNDKGERTGSAIGRGLENVGLRSKGTQAGKDQARVSEASKRVGLMDEASKTKMANGKAWGMTEHDRVAAISDKVKNGRLSDLGSTTDQKIAVDRAEAYMGRRRIGSTIEGKSAVRTEALKQNPNIGRDAQETREAVQKQTPAEFSRNIDKTAFSAPVIGAMSNEQMTYMRDKGPMSKRKALKDYANKKGTAAAILAQYKATKDPAERSRLYNNFKQAKTLL